MSSASAQHIWNRGWRLVVGHHQKSYKVNKPAVPVSALLLYLATLNFAQDR